MISRRVDSKQDESCIPIEKAAGRFSGALRIDSEEETCYFRQDAEFFA